MLRLEAAVDQLAHSAYSCLGSSDCDVYFEDRDEDDPRCVRCVAEQKARAMG